MTPDLKEFLEKTVYDELLFCDGLQEDMANKLIAIIKAQDEAMALCIDRCRCCEVGGVRLEYDDKISSIIKGA